jgi:hypothetical protein
LKIHFNIILSSMPEFSKLFPSLRSPHQNPVRASPLPHMCYIPLSSHSSWFDQVNNNIWWSTQIIKLLVM